MEPVALARLAYEAAVDKKANDVRVLDVSCMTTIADYFVIASAPNRPHVEAIADNVIEKLEKAGVKPHHVEGRGAATWLLLDYGSVIVHVFHEDARAFYNLERLWGDAKAADLDLARPVSYN